MRGVRQAAGHNTPTKKQTTGTHHQNLHVPLPAARRLAQPEHARGPQRVPQLRFLAPPTTATNRRQQRLRQRQGRQQHRPPLAARRRVFQAPQPPQLVHHPLRRRHLLGVPRPAHAAASATAGARTAAPTPARLPFPFPFPLHHRASTTAIAGRDRARQPLQGRQDRGGVQRLGERRLRAVVERGRERRERGGHVRLEPRLVGRVRRDAEVGEVHP